METQRSAVRCERVNIKLQKKKVNNSRSCWRLACIDRESNTGPIDGNDGFYH